MQAESSSSFPPLPRNALEWLKVFGPGAIVASLTIGAGELIFSTRGGALFGFRILFVFAVISAMKWGLVLACSHHMLLTGVHPYERMHDLPGPRGWLPLALLLICAACMPIWISFHSGVLGNLTSWLTNTRTVFNGGADYLWGALILLGVFALSISGGYAVMERVQMWIVGGLVFCAGLTLLLYKPDWLEVLYGLIPRPLAYPDWLPSRYPQIAEHSVWIETTRYVGVIGGAGFDYLAYTSWLREKGWGILPGRATSEKLAEMSQDSEHRARRWLRAPLVDSTISFALVIAFSAVFVASGAMILGPRETVPDEDNLLNLQARFVTEIHPWLLPLYAAGAFLTMIGTLYGTIEISAAIADEIARSFKRDWSPRDARRLKLAVIAWCAPIAFAILGWLFIRQSGDATTPSPPVANQAVAESETPRSASDGLEKPQGKPRLLLMILTPVNLFTGVMSCGLICFLSIWMDRRYLPRELRLPSWLTALNLGAGIVFLGLGLKGFWDHEGRGFAVVGLFVVIAVAAAIAAVLQTIRSPLQT